MNVPSITEVLRFIAASNVSKWNAVIPKCALNVQEDGDSIKFLHPTKGWRWVSKRRVGMA